MTPRHLAPKPKGGGPRPPSTATGAVAATQDDDEGTPTDWLFLAMAEQQLNHTDEAGARLDQATRWIDQARRDPRHPWVLGAFSDPGGRQISRMTAGIQVLPGFAPTRRGKSDPISYFMPTWRQMLVVEVLRREAASLIMPRATIELPRS